MRNDGIKMSSLNIPEVTTELGHNDVLLGRGAASINYVGNVLFREIVRERREEYLSTAKRQTKDNIAREIIDVVNSRNGRFVRKVASSEEKISLNIPEHTNVYVVVAKEKVLEKVKQSLRDKAYNPHEKSVPRTCNTSEVNINDDEKSLNATSEMYPKPYTMATDDRSRREEKEPCMSFNNNTTNLQQMYAGRISNSEQLGESFPSRSNNQSEDSLFQESIRQHHATNNTLQFSVSDRVNQLLRENQELNQYRIQPSLLINNNNHASFSHSSQTMQEGVRRQRDDHPFAALCAESQQFLNARQRYCNNNDERNLLDLLNRSRNNLIQQRNSQIHDLLQQNSSVVPFQGDINSNINSRSNDSKKQAPTDETDDDRAKKAIRKSYS